MNENVCFLFAAEMLHLHFRTREIYRMEFVLKTVSPTHEYTNTRISYTAVQACNSLLLLDDDDDSKYIDRVSVLFILMGKRIRRVLWIFTLCCHVICSHIVGRRMEKFSVTIDIRRIFRKIPERSDHTVWCGHSFDSYNAKWYKWNDANFLYFEKMLFIFRWTKKGR